MPGCDFPNHSKQNSKATQNCLKNNKIEKANFSTLEVWFWLAPTSFFSYENRLLFTVIYVLKLPDLIDSVHILLYEK